MWLRVKSVKSSCIAKAQRPRAPACSGSSRARWRRPATSCAAKVSRVAHQRITRRRPRDEPHEGDAELHLGAVKKLLAERGVELLSAGLDEVPGVYKDIHAVMAAQTDLVEVLGQFDPKLVKMCPAGDRAED